MADDVVQAWLDKVADDLKTVRNCVHGPEPIVSTAAYHCQQAAEKLVKAVLVHAGIHPPKTHDIDRLLKLIDAAHPLIGHLQSLGSFTPYVWVFRYPAMNPLDTSPTEPSLEEVQRWHDQISTLKIAFEQHTVGASP